MSGSTNTKLVNFCKFVEDELKLAIVDEEFLKSAFNKLEEYSVKDAATEEEFIENNIHVLLRVVEDALEQKTMPLQTQMALANYGLACQQEATIRNIEARRRNGFSALMEKRSFHN